MNITHISETNVSANDPQGPKLYLVVDESERIQITVINYYSKSGNQEDYDLALNEMIEYLMSCKKQPQIFISQSGTNKGKSEIVS